MALSYHITGQPQTSMDRKKYTYTVTDVDGDTDSLEFKISVEADSLPTFNGQTIKYTAIDAEGTADVEEFTITVNAPPAPPAPTVTLQVEGDDNVNNIAEDADGNGITFSGTATPGETVRVSASGDAIAVAIADEHGAWKATARPGSLGKSGDANVTAIVANAGGTATAQLTLSVDLQAPTLAYGIVLTSFSGKTNEANPTVVILASEAGVFSFGGLCGPAAQTVLTEAAANKELLTTFGPLAEGVYSGCSVTLTDAAGNASASWTFWDFEVDTTAPTIAKAFLSRGDEVLLTFSENMTRSGSIQDFKIMAYLAPAEDAKPSENDGEDEGKEPKLEEVVAAGVAEIYFSGNGNLEDHEILLELKGRLDPSQYKAIYVEYAGSSVTDEAGNQLGTTRIPLDFTE